MSAALEHTRLKAADAAYAAVGATLGADLGESISLAQLAKRPGVTAQLIYSLLPFAERSEASEIDVESALADSLYAGYLGSQRSTLERLHQHDGLKIPGDLDFRKLSGLSHEMIERLERAEPQTFGQARRIPGLTPAALSTLLVQLNLPRARA